MLMRVDIVEKIILTKRQSCLSYCSMSSQPLNLGFLVKGFSQVIQQKTRGNKDRDTNARSLFQEA